ncbi:hypothetical protein Nepgr_030088 [Nepenthes gracilis]|uniref:Uncharacterized protein n=1 Tax=Nepenthes gracilis TaxID=150966 RepID=A0AAD3Y5H8_NEPGR|nr:hypothetical protein Nepgr_030088 [Nepenthes gracilis]
MLLLMLIGLMLMGRSIAFGGFMLLSHPMPMSPMPLVISRYTLDAEAVARSWNFAQQLVFVPYVGSLDGGWLSDAGAVQSWWFAACEVAEFLWVSSYLLTPEFWLLVIVMWVVLMPNVMLKFWLCCFLVYLRLNAYAAVVMGSIAEMDGYWVGVDGPLSADTV